MSEPRNNVAEFMIGLMCGIGCFIAAALLAALGLAALPTNGALTVAATVAGVAATVALVVRFFRHGRSACAAGAITGAMLPFLAMGACAAIIAANGGFG